MELTWTDASMNEIQLVAASEHTGSSGTAGERGRERGDVGLQMDKRA